ncbi:hypothetical protein [Mycolicibacter arupensis]|uniref:Uncharacterized protein n=1 Tax=Mycolicibacter arupensis TaxID=342002 RepID=A0A0F5MXH5_9MYCO|nr:hypothetical protein [Mycolicibacter arupensis]KKB98727.1 hypothetical protein WR43_13180 [Mycolicibacter arupensis]OQZ95105.1 hypothetical protein BST15_14915 [Mycolicibacter arupensis]
MGHISGHPDVPGARRAEPEPMVIDCDDCAVRGPACRDCVVSVLLGVPNELLEDERAALDVLAEAGMAPRLRLVPIRGERGATPRSGVA